MKDGFQKINLTDDPEGTKEKANEDQGTQKENNLKIKVKGPKGSPKRLTAKKVLFITPIILLILIVMVIAWQVKRTYSSFQNTYRNAKEIVAAVKDQNIVLVNEKIKSTRISLTETKKNLSGLSWTKALPVLGAFYSDAEHGVNAAFYGLDASEALTSAIEPYADILGLKGKGTFAGGSAEERIIKVIQTLDKIVPKIDLVSQNLDLMQKEVNQIDVSRYPETIKGVKVKSELTKGIALINDGSKIVTETKPLLTSLPKLLGEPEAQKYLILFQNDKELRSTGGFITAYAVLRVEGGKMHLEKADDIYKLDETRTKTIKAPAPIHTYLNEDVWFIRNANISPDFYLSMKNFEDLYSNAKNQLQFDGIIAIDTHVLVKILEVLGPVPAYGTNFSAEKVKECDCPMVIYELEKFADIRIAKEREGRKDIIGVLMQSIMQKTLASPKQYWSPLFQTAVNEINEKHILFYLHDQNAQKGMELLNAAGRIRNFEGDYLHVNDTNFGGAKSNMFVEENIEQKYEVGSDGTITANLTISYKNPYPLSPGCDLERGGLCLNGMLRNWVRVYVPKGSTLVEGRGSEIKITASEDLDKTVFEGFLIVRPLGNAQMELRYTLPFKKEKGKDYSLLVQKQPGPDGNGYKIFWNGKLVDQFDLKADKEIKFKI